MRFISLALLLSVLVACSAKLAIPTQADADKGAAKFPGYTLSDMNAGKSAFEVNCGKCHGLKKPSSRTEDQWKETVPRMVKKANKKEEKINAKTQEDILRYLIVMAKQ